MYEYCTGTALSLGWYRTRGALALHWYAGMTLVLHTSFTGAALEGKYCVWAALVL